MSGLTPSVREPTALLPPDPDPEPEPELLLDWLPEEFPPLADPEFEVPDPLTDCEALPAYAGYGMPALKVCRLSSFSPASLLARA